MNVLEMSLEVQVKCVSTSRIVRYCCTTYFFQVVEYCSIRTLLFQILNLVYLTNVMAYYLVHAIVLYAAGMATWEPTPTGCSRAPTKELMWIDRKMAAPSGHGQFCLSVR